jgi:hypothetical protein
MTPFKNCTAIMSLKWDHKEVKENIMSQKRETICKLTNLKKRKKIIRE